MNPGAVGPVHAFPHEVLWSITTGVATLRVLGEEHTVGPGDTVVLPGGEMRQFTAGPDGFTAVVATADGARAVVTREGDDDGTVPPWVS